VGELRAAEGSGPDSAAPGPGAAGLAGALRLSRVLGECWGGEQGGGRAANGEQQRRLHALSVEST
jgi:hypothetical protein